MSLHNEAANIQQYWCEFNCSGAHWGTADSTQPLSTAAARCREPTGDCTLLAPLRSLGCLTRYITGHYWPEVVESHPAGNMMFVCTPAATQTDRLTGRHILEQWQLMFVKTD
jgi:hypothetical protein